MNESRKALIVGVNLNNDDFFEESLEELKNLVFSLDIEIVDIETQNLKAPNSALYVGSGKLDEISQIIKNKNIDLVIFDNELSPSQLKNITEILKVEVLDRTAIILEIFNIRSRTKEAKMQVEMARLKYMLPRLVGMHTSLGRQGSGAGLSNKGLGEKKIELDRRMIEDKIAILEKKLDDLLNQRNVQSRKRKKSSLPLVSLVGYTNAGKSTLMNAMISKYVGDEEKKVFTQDMLFATLDTTVRNITMPDNKSFLLSDTVGFINKLPHHLIKAFRSTLEEVKNADLLVEVIDYSDKNYDKHIEVTKKTLNEIGAGNIPIIYVYNKSDLMLDRLPLVDNDGIYLSATKQVGIEELVELIKSKVFSNYIKCTMKIPFKDLSIISYLKKNATINEIEFLEDGTKIMLDCKISDYMKYKEYVIDV